MQVNVYKKKGVEVVGHDRKETEIQLRLSFSDQAFQVTVKTLKHIPQMDGVASGGAADPYVDIFEMSVLEYSRSMKPFGADF